MYSGDLGVRFFAAALPLVVDAAFFLRPAGAFPVVVGCG